ncbi:DUF393-like protein [Fragilaria crotonensis]|nr:DUF393-like protein [Fragilaria crotonensis]
MRIFLPLTLITSRTSAFNLSNARLPSHVLRAMLSTNASPSQRLFSEELSILYDSKCNVCKLEIDFLRRRDERLHGSSTRLKFTDLESEDYDGKTQRTALSTMKLA